MTLKVQEERSHISGFCIYGLGAETRVQRDSHAFIDYVSIMGIQMIIFRGIWPFWARMKIKEVICCPIDERVSVPQMLCPEIAISFYPAGSIVLEDFHVGEPHSTHEGMVITLRN